MIATAAPLLIPLIVMLFDTIAVLTATFDCDVKEKVSGVVSGAAVVTVNVPDTPPIVSVAVDAVENRFAERWRRLRTGHSPPFLCCSYMRRR